VTDPNTAQLIADQVRAARERAADPLFDAICAIYAHALAREMPGTAPHVIGEVLMHAGVRGSQLGSAEATIGRHRLAELMIYAGEHLYHGCAGAPPEPHPIGKGETRT
jgi:hypothetical protein